MEENKRIIDYVPNEYVKDLSEFTHKWFYNENNPEIEKSAFGIMYDYAVSHQLTEKKNQE